MFGWRRRYVRRRFMRRRMGCAGILLLSFGLIALLALVRAALWIR